MIEIPFLNKEKIKKFFYLNDKIFKYNYNESLIHQVIVSFYSNSRNNNSFQKDKSMLNYSKRKPWRQKGTGRARAGTRSSPIWRGGGRTFPNSSKKKFSHKINKKMYKLCIRSILSKLFEENRISIINYFNSITFKTKHVLNKIKKFGDSSILIITNDIDQNTYLSTRNLKNILVTETRYINPLFLLKYKKILITKSAIKKFEELLK